MAFRCLRSKSNTSYVNFSPSRISFLLDHIHHLHWRHANGVGFLFNCRDIKRVRVSKVFQRGKMAIITSGISCPQANNFMELKVFSYVSCSYYQCGKFHQCSSKES